MTVSPYGTMTDASKRKDSGSSQAHEHGHKAALARGRAESATVRHYLEALETSKPKRGRKRTPASIDRRLAAIDSQLAGADALTRLHLLQEQKDLLDERSRVDGVKDLSALEKQFVKVAKAYGERKGITYGTWRAAGVSAAVLQKAEIAPGSERRLTRPAPAQAADRRLWSFSVWCLPGSLLLGVLPRGGGREVLLDRLGQAAAMTC